MPDSFGLKIGLEGEAEFRQGLREINQSFKVLGSEMTLVTSQFDRQDKSIEAVTARNSVLNKEIDAQKDKIDTLEKALANASSSFGENDKRTQSWAIQLNNAKAELNGMERELDSNNKALDETGKEMDNAGKDAGKFGEELKKSADTADDAGGRFEKLGSIVKGIGVAVGAAVTAIGAAAAAAGKELYDMATNAASAGDRIDKTSQKLGLSAEGFQEWDYVLSQNGASIDSLSAGMNKLNNSVDDVMSGNEKAAEKFNRLGISMDDLRGKSREEIFNLTVEGLQGISDESEKAAIASDLLGKAAVNLAPLLNQTAEDTDALKRKANDLGMVMSESAVDAAVVYTDSIDTLNRSITGMKNKIGAELLPGFTMITDGITGVLNGQSDAGEQIKAGVTEIVTSMKSIIPEVLAIFTNVANVATEVAPEIIEALVTGIMDNLPVIVDAAVSIIQTALTAIMSALPQLTEAGVLLLTAVVGAVLDNLPLIVRAAAETVTALASGLGEALPKLIPAAVEAVTTIVQTLMDNMNQILDAALKIVVGLTQGILDSIPVLVNALPEIIMSLVNFLLGAIPQIIETGIQLLTSLVTALPDIIKAIVAVIPLIVDSVIKAVVDSIPLIIDSGIKLLVSLVKALPDIIITIVEAIPLIVNSIVDAVVGNIDLIVDAGVQLFVALIENLPIIIMELVNAVPQIVDSIVKAIGSMVWKLAEVGGDLIRGLWQGISDAGAWLWDQVTGFFGGVVDGIKGFLGIHSPSTVFADIGGNMAAGIGEGFGDAMDGVSRGMEKDMPTGYDMSGLVSNESGLVDKVVSTWDAILLMSANYWALIQNNFKTIQTSAMSTIRSICEGITATIKDVFTGSGWYDIGDGIIRGVIDGMRGAADDLANEAAQAAAAALNAARGAVVPSAIPVPTSGVTGSVPQGSHSGTGGTMTQVTINSPKPLSEKETAREFEKVSQKLALGVK